MNIKISPGQMVISGLTNCIKVNGWNNIYTGYTPVYILRLYNYISSHFGNRFFAQGRLERIRSVPTWCLIYWHLSESNKGLDYWGKYISTVPNWSVEQLQ